LENFANDNCIQFTIARASKHKNVPDDVKHIYDTFIQRAVTELRNRFSKHQMIVARIMHLLPSDVVDKTFDDVKNKFGFYESDIQSSDIDIITAEF
jgi:hypothetical protein